MLKSFDEVIKIEELKRSPRTVALVGGEAIHALEALKATHAMGAINYLLYGNRDLILPRLEELDMPEAVDKIVDTASPEESSVQAIRAVLAGQADVILKGQVDTKVIMGQMVKSANGFKVSSVVHSLVFCEIETHHKLVCMTDGSVLIEPTVDQKRAIIESSVSVLHTLGLAVPKVAVLSAVEKPNPKIKSSVEARELQTMFEGRTDCIVEGPLAFDLAMSSEAAQLKGFSSRVAGDADLLIFPNIDTGNNVVKALTTTGHNRTGSVILGLKAPIAMSSRSATMENKLRSILLAASMVK